MDCEASGACYMWSCGAGAHAQATNDERETSIQNTHQ